MTEAELSAILAAVPDLAFALLFGSRADDRARAASDWDVGLFFDAEVDAAARFDRRRRLAADLPMTERVDLVDLHTANGLLGHQALRGRPLVMNDRQAYVRYFIKTMGEAEDERHFTRIHHRARLRRLEEGRFGRP